MPAKFSTTITEEQKQDIINSYLSKTETIQEISDRYGKNHKTIRNFLKENNIHILTSTDTSLKNRLSEEEKQDITNLYTKENWTIQQIAKKYNCDSTKTLPKLMKELGIEIKDTKFQQQYDINRNFFKKIDSEEKAYWLGFLYADGYILRYKDKIQGFGCTLSIEDLEHLQKLKHSLKSEHNIEIRKEHIFYDKNSNKEYITQKACRFDIQIKEVAEDLINLGCVPAKSLILQYPTENQIPLKLQHHFIRGYFDGDGCISWDEKRQTYHIVNILGTEEFLQSIKNFLSIDNIYLRKKDSLYELRFASKKTITDFYNKIYKDATIYLDRKYDKFRYFLSKIKEKKEVN